MRLVSWNCGSGFHRKISALSALTPDVAIVQECADLGTLARKAPEFAPTDALVDASISRPLTWSGRSSSSRLMWTQRSRRPQRTGNLPIGVISVAARSFDNVSQAAMRASSLVAVRRWRPSVGFGFAPRNEDEWTLIDRRVFQPDMRERERKRRDWP